MRGVIQEQLLAGETDEAILAYFVSVHDESVLAAPHAERASRDPGTGAAFWPRAVPPRGRQRDRRARREPRNALSTPADGGASLAPGATDGQGDMRE